MYHILYPNDTPENRASFLSDWIQTQFQKMDEIYYGMSAETLARNISRCYFHIGKDAVVKAFTDNGYVVEEKEGKTYLNIAPESSGLRQIREEWN